MILNYKKKIKGKNKVRIVQLYQYLMITLIIIIFFFNDGVLARVTEHFRS